MKLAARQSIQAVLIVAMFAMTSACHRTSKSSDADASALSGRLAKSAGAGNGDGYLGMISTAYQVLPGYTCNDGTTTKLAHAAALIQQGDGKYLLTGDACSGKAEVIHSSEVHPNTAGNLIAVRGGLFEVRAELPAPTNDANDSYSQIVCSWRTDNVEYTARMNSNMAGTDMRLRIHKKWRDETGDTQGAWVAKNILVTGEAIGTTQIYHGVSEDLLIEIDLTRKTHRSKEKYLASFSYSSATESVGSSNAVCIVNRKIPERR